MSNDLQQYLSSGSRGASLSPEKMELMGKEAANLLIQKNVPMNESIAKMAGAYEDINQEQVSRVVEFANTAAYLSFHDKNKTAGSDSSYPQFELADAARVFQDLNDGARPTRITQTDVDYGRLPEKQKVSSAKTEAALEELFRPAHSPALDFSKESAVDDILGAKSDLVALKDSLEHSGEAFDLLYKDASALYYDEVKRHLLDGGSFADVLRGATETGTEPEKVASVLEPLMARLVEERVTTYEALADGTDDLTKVAHRVVDTTHPFVATFGALISYQKEMDKIAAALDEVDPQLAKVQAFIRETFLAP